MTLAAGAESSKSITSPFIMRVIAMNIAPIPINTFATLPVCISRSPCLARQAQHAFPKVALRELQVNVWVIFLVVNDSHDYVEPSQLNSQLCQ
jgi:hypothetical protein